MNSNKTHIQVKNSSGYLVNANVLVGDSGSFSSGDILDANATEELVKNTIDDLVDGASSALDTLKELGDAIPTKTSQLTNDSNFATVSQIPSIAEIAAALDIDLYVWRLWTAEVDSPKFLLCNKRGQLILDSGNHSIEATLSGSVVGSIQETSPGAGAMMVAGWGSQVVTIEVGQSAMRIDGFEFTLATMAGWRQVCSEFEVFTTSYGRPTGNDVRQVLVKFGVDVGFGERRSYGSSSLPATCLLIETPTDEYPEDSYYAMPWTDWSSGDRSVPFDIGDGIVCTNGNPEGANVPQGAVYSFGNLIDY